MCYGHFSYNDLCHTDTSSTSDGPYSSFPPPARLSAALTRDYQYTVAKWRVRQGARMLSVPILTLLILASTWAVSQMPVIGQAGSTGEFMITGDKSEQMKEMR